MLMKIEDRRPKIKAGRWKREKREEKNVIPTEPERATRNLNFTHPS